MMRKYDLKTLKKLFDEVVYKGITPNTLIVKGSEGDDIYFDTHYFKVVNKSDKICSIFGLDVYVDSSLKENQAYLIDSSQIIVLNDEDKDWNLNDKIVDGLATEMFYAYHVKKCRDLILDDVENIPLSVLNIEHRICVPLEEVEKIINKRFGDLK